MARVKGTPKTGGRQKGTPNKRTRELNEIFESINFNIPERLAAIIPALPLEKQADVYLKLMEFQYPKRKAVEVKDESTSTHSLLVNLIKQRNMELAS